ncbi:MAG: carboxypeptidase regulatory-like domain-containing protein [Bryobacteraceae bacterium]|nr:carboxypeptidase regulatory-like domain-containing protein [Bryobacteraceae bacterium]
MASARLRLAVCALFSALCLSAQTQTATIRGIVQDSSGAVVPAAALTLTNTGQNRPWTTRSNDAGAFVFGQIPPGNYSLEVEAQGFKKFVRGGLIFQVAQVAEINVSLEVGAVSETVQVNAETPLLETASSTLGEVVNSITSENLPLNGRNVLQLVALTPGIATNSSFRDGGQGGGSITAVGFSANGGRNVSTAVMLDGSPQEVMGYNQPAYVPSPDALMEFKVQTNSMSAEYGRTGGAVVNMVHRSGTSQFHGVLYEFLRNNVLDANGFFNNVNRRRKAAFRYNQFGFTAGGPLTPSRQTTFFFVNYEGIRQVNPGEATFSVPTALMRQGNFSEVNGVIYDPLTINATGERTPFNGNLIPAARINPVGQKLISFYPQTNRPGVVNNYFSQAGASTGRNNVSVKIDRRISQRQNLFGRFSWENANTNLANHYGNAGTTTPGFSGARNRSGTIDDNYLVGGWILHGNYGYSYHSNPRDPLDLVLKPSDLGFPSAVDAVTQFAIFPSVGVAGYAQLGPESSFIIGNKFETHTWTGDMAKLFGTHSIKIGGSYRLNRVSNFRPNNPAGQYSFNDSWTRRFFNRTGGGDAIASMLLGLASGGQIRSEPALSLQVKYTGIYVQDDWRVNDRLTLNFGLRWDADFPQTERFDRASWFDFDVTNPLNPPGLGPQRGGLVFAGARTPGAPRGIKDFDSNNFGPRIGLAYKLSERLVLRSGLGIFYAPTTGFGPNATNAGALGFNAITPYTSSIDGGRTPYATMSNPYPDGFIPPENGQNGLLTFAGQGINGNFRRDRVPYSAQWNFNVQYQLPDNMLFDIAYAGNSGVKLQANSQLNQIPDSALALGDDLNRVVANPFSGLLPAATALGRPTTTLGQLQRPFAWNTGVTQQWGAMAHSTYHALQTKFRKRYANGLQFLAAYTWSKAIDDVSSVAGFLGDQNPGYTNNNRRDLDRSLSAIHVPHVLAVNFQWDLPFGKGKSWLNHGGVVDHVVGGWSLNGISSIQSGTPISIASRNNTTNSFGGGQRPNSTGISSATAGSAAERRNGWFNPAAFVDAPIYTFGNVGRFLPDNFGPKLHNWDISILKNFSITERFRLQFRTELFNAFNNVNFNNPAGTTLGQPNFGTITGAEAARIIQFGLKLYY